MLSGADHWKDLCVLGGIILKSTVNKYGLRKFRFLHSSGILRSVSGQPFRPVHTGQEDP
jgi:hypothetical protein